MQYFGGKEDVDRGYDDSLTEVYQKLGVRDSQARRTAWLVVRLCFCSAALCSEDEKVWLIGIENVCMSWRKERYIRSK